MCIIVDANAAAIFLGRSSAVLAWLLGPTGEPRLVAASRLKAELFQVDTVRRLLVELDRAGRLRSAFDNVDRTEEELQAGGGCRSNDAHVLALALESGARTLITFDEDLTADFKDSEIVNTPRGSVYRDPDVHAHLLRHTPTSCGIKVNRKRRRS
jgi:predicted nucleic acid-binding protein